VFASSCQHCGALFMDTPQFVCEAYDHIAQPIPWCMTPGGMGGLMPTARVGACMLSK
jgi:hypothetical protein